jgi:4-amino-4-deoxy-L-arabinose transferase-like glycosyltransferase
MKKPILSYLLGIAVILFIVIFKYPHLFLPHFWDEAWSYSPAVQYLYDHGLGITPSALPPELSKGHPLLFFFLFATWMKIFGTSLFVKHAFALLISVALLVTLFFTTKKLFNPFVASLSVLFLAFQSLFLAQSSMMLPEMLLALLTILTFYFYIRDKKIGYLITGSLLVLTKETGILLILVILVYDLVLFLKEEGFLKKIRSQFLRLLVLFIPLFIFILFILLQKRTNGWFFYPEHINFITGVETGRNQLEMYLNQFFVLHGQFLLVFLLIISLFISFYRKGEREVSTKRPLSLLLSFFVAYLLFSSFNFFSPRYLLSIAWILAVFCSYFLFKATGDHPGRSFLAGIMFAGILFYYAEHVKNNGDYDLGYVHAVSLQKQAIEYCEQNDWYNDGIYCNFLMHEALMKKPAGFLKGNAFSKVLVSLNDAPEFLIFNNIEPDPEYGKVAGNENYVLLKRFNEGWMWVEIYSRK